MKRLAVLLLAIAFSGLSCAQNRTLEEGGDYPRPLGLDWEMTEAQMLETLKTRGLVATVDPEFDQPGAKVYRVPLAEFAGYKAYRAIVGLTGGKLATVTITFPAGNKSIEIWFRLVHETKKRFGPVKKKFEPLSQAEQKSAARGKKMAAASWVFPGRDLLMAIYAQKGVFGQDVVIFSFGNSGRMRLYIAAMKEAAAAKKLEKRKDF